MTTHMHGRQNVLTRGLDELEACLAAIAKSFDIAWLSDTDGEHPLQKLWRRKDVLATNQLIIFGDSLSVMRGINENFVRKHVQIIKSDVEPNNRKGSFFEIIGLRLLHKPPAQQIVPTRSNQPGYDGSLRLKNGLRLELSLKNYGTSTHELWVRDQCRALESAFVSSLKTSGRTGLELRAIAKGYPGTDDWVRLNRSLTDILSHTSKPGETARDGFWSVSVHPISSEFHPLSQKNLSHLVTMLVPQHQNEKQNLISKLDKAYANANKHAVGVGEQNVCRAVMVHIPPTADMSACKQWADQYFQDTPNGLVDLVVLYQPAVVANGHQSVIMHSIELAFTQAFRAWVSRAGGKMPPFAFDLPVGVGGPASRTILQSDTGLQLEATGFWYTYQSGVIWTAFTQENGQVNAMLSNPASGVVRHATVEFEAGGEIELHGVFPPDNDLLIFE